MSPSPSRVEWQPLVVQSVFIASSSSPKSVWLGNECNWSFWYQWCVGPRVACGDGFLRSVPHRSLLELVKPRRRNLVGIIKPSFREMEIRPAKAKLQVLHVVSELEKTWVDWMLWLLLPFAGVILFYPVKETLFNLGNLTPGKLRWKGPWQTCSPKEFRGKVWGSLSFTSAHGLWYWSQLSACSSKTYVVCHVSVGWNTVWMRSHNRESLLFTWMFCLLSMTTTVKNVPH